MVKPDIKLPERKLLAIAKEHFAELEQKKDSLDNYFIVYQDGAVSSKYTGQACFSQFKNLFKKDGYHYYPVNEENFDRTPALFVITHPTGPKGDPKECELEYFRWLLNWSPYARVFVSKNAEKVWQEPVVLRCGFSPNLIISAAIAVRYRYEYRNRLSEWAELKDVIGPTKAFWFMQMMAPGLHQGSNVWSPLERGGHGCWNACDFKVDGLNAFFSKTPLPKISTVAEKNWEYGPLAAAFGNKGEKIKWPKANIYETKGAFGPQSVNGWKTEDMPAMVEEFFKRNGVELDD